MVIGNVTETDDLNYLRKESLHTVISCLTAGLYLWCVFLFHVNNRFGLVWLGPVLLGGGLSVAFLTQDRNPSLAAAALILGVAAADLYSISNFAMDKIRSHSWHINKRSEPVATDQSGLAF